MYAEYATVQTDFRSIFLVKVDRSLFSGTDDLDAMFRIVSKSFPEMEGAFIWSGQDLIQWDCTFGSTGVRRLVVGEPPSEMTWTPIEIDDRSRQVSSSVR